VLLVTALLSAHGSDREKTSVTMLAHSSAMIVTAQTYRAGRPAGVSAFLVELDSDGLMTSDIADTGWQAMGRGTVSFDGVRVGAAALLGTEGSAFRTVLNGFDFTRPLLALTGIGCAQACLDETAGYARTREAFGSPLARFEGVSFPLAEHATTLEAARLLCYLTLWRRSRGLRHTAEAAMAELPFEQRLRDVMAVEIADGTAQIQKIIIARERYGADFVPYQR
jgi:cyclohexanecarboxyl-CoA dehydrogenase